MSLNRLIVIAIAFLALAIAAPRFLPGLLELAVTAPAAIEAAPLPAVTPPPVDRDLQPQSGLGEPEKVGRLAGRTVVLRADPRGHYQTEATVNGRTIPVMIDTGATAVALSAEAAKRVGVRPTRRDYTLPISTANGVVAAAPVVLSEVRVGRISVRNVQAVVVPDGALGVNLLGMTFLSRLSRFEIAGGELLLAE
ncbi:MAG: TIGR02281 family clan AA aspartic protease [Bauldia sp.]